jgi:V/A-type H+-transporting ATPase subunit I
MEHAGFWRSEAMGHIPVYRASIVLPRSALPEAARLLSEFTWFHPDPREDTLPDRGVTGLADIARTLMISLNEVCTWLQLKDDPGVISSLRHGYSVTEQTIEAQDWEALVRKLQLESGPLEQKVSSLRAKMEDFGKMLADREAALALLDELSSFSFDLAQVTSLKRIKVALIMALTKDVKEIRLALGEVFTLDSLLKGGVSLLLVATSPSDAEKTDKILRNFDVKHVAIGEGLPQNPAEAFNKLLGEKQQIELSIVSMKKELAEFKTNNGEKLLTLRDAASTVYSTLNDLRKTIGLQRVALLQGYIPSTSISDFKNMFGRWITHVDTTKHKHHGEDTQNPPSIISNSSPVAAFEPITLSQGSPKHGELDPTFIIALVFPIFYGFMFADLGQGIVLALFGLLLRARGQPSIKSWGTLFIAAGSAAAVAGIAIGEAFGLKVNLLPFLHDFHPLLEVELRGGHVQTVIIQLLTVALIFGIVHLTSGFLLDVVKGMKEGDKVELYTMKIPTVIMYLSGVVFVLSFLGNNQRFTGLLDSANPVPLLSGVVDGLTVSQAMSVTMPILLGSILVIIAGKPIAIVLGRYHKESFGMAVTMGIIEFLLRAIEGLANTISYARLAILLIVHVALMFAVNLAWSLGPAGIPIIVIGNIGVMLLEGMIVFIQDLRLHLYEWFTKFYEGTGVPFRRLILGSNRVKIRWVK